MMPRIVGDALARTVETWQGAASLLITDSGARCVADMASLGERQVCVFPERMSGHVSTPVELGLLMERVKRPQSGGVETRKGSGGRTG
jgi:hypothetical protein